ncbi:hypothetical protein ACLMJK_007378 [Lecanora helva]
MKIGLLLFYQYSTHWFSPFWGDEASAFPGGHNSLSSENGIHAEGNVRGQIEAPYRDDDDYDGQGLSSGANTRDVDRAEDQDHAVQPSRLHNEGNEWRDVRDEA